MEWITIDNGIVTGHFVGDKFPETGSFIEVVDFNGITGLPVNFYDKNWKIKPKEQLVEEGVIPIPEGMKLENGVLVSMTDIERIKAGIDKLPKGYKIENDKIVPMTQFERIEAGIEVLPEGYKIVDKKIIEMSLVEKIEAGIEKIPIGYKIEEGQILPMNDEERFSSGQITQEEYNKIQYQKLVERLNEIDKKSIRAIRAILAGVGTEEDKKFLKDLEEQAIVQRTALHIL